MILFLIFSRQQYLTFHAYCLYWRQFAWNAKIWQKKRNIFQNVVCWNFYPAYYALIFISGNLHIILLLCPRTKFYKTNIRWCWHSDFPSQRKILIFPNCTGFLNFTRIRTSSCGHGTKAVIQTHKSINEWRIRMFRPTDMDPRIKGVIRHPRIVSITW